MMGPPSPMVPPEVASHVLEGLETCSASLRRLFQCKFPIERCLSRVEISQLKFWNLLLMWTCTQLLKMVTWQTEHGSIESFCVLAILKKIFKSVWLFTNQSFSELLSSSKSAQERRNSWEVGQSLIFDLFVTQRSSSQWYRAFLSGPYHLVSTLFWTTGIIFFQKSTVSVIWPLFYLKP